MVAKAKEIDVEAGEPVLSLSVSMFELYNQEVYDLLVREGLGSWPGCYYQKGTSLGLGMRLRVR